MRRAIGRIDVFGTSGIRGPFQRVSPELALRFGAAVASRTDRAVVARDGRHTGPTLERAVVAGLTSGGCTVERIGLAPTHAGAWAARERDAVGIVVTASHNPPGDNGLKLFGADGREAPPDVEAAVEDAMADGATSPATSWGAVREGHVAADYLDAAERHLAETGAADAVADGGDTPTVALDCANGAGALTTPPLLRRLGCRVVTVNGQIDGSFPGRPSKPTPESLGGFREFVVDGSDVGIAHDGDADRTVVVGPDGDVVPEDAVLAVLAADAVERHGADEPLVLTTPNASARVDEAVAAAGGRVERVPLGGLPPALADAEDLAFAAEPWKHVFPRFGPWVDGSVTAARLVALLAEAGGVEALFGELLEIAVTKRTVACGEGDKEAVMAAVGERLEESHDVPVDRTDGLRLDLGEGRWLLVRPSGTEPLIRVYGEGDPALVEETVALVEDVVPDV